VIVELCVFTVLTMTVNIGRIYLGAIEMAVEANGSAAAMGDDEGE
jgi:hypothetical protein